MWIAVQFLAQITSLSSTSTTYLKGVLFEMFSLFTHKKTAAILIGTVLSSEFGF
jgi:hypothetical protein